MGTVVRDFLLLCTDLDLAQPDTGLHGWVLHCCHKQPGFTGSGSIESNVGV